MKGATHFIEIFRTKNSKPLAGPLSRIKNLPAWLKHTKDANMITIAVWKIKFKNEQDLQSSNVQ